MSRKTLFVGAALALAVGSAASAQTAAPTPAAAPPAAPAAPAPATVADFKAGDVVKDSDGAVVGTVVKAGAATNGQLAVVVNIDGKDVSLPGNLFTVADGSVTAQATKAQIQAAIPKS
ncbi:MAG TPA: hypothetical protein VMU59_09860 [Caulobacteraceae bacterium]|nr:hypothetical protein [Caulobacteraceae bacterium]